MKTIMAHLSKLENYLRKNPIKPTDPYPFTDLFMVVLAILGGAAYIAGLGLAGGAGLGLFVGGLGKYLYRFQKEYPLLYGLCEGLVGVLIATLNVISGDGSNVTQRVSLLAMGIYLTKRGFQSIFEGQAKAGLA